MDLFFGSIGILTLFVGFGMFIFSLFRKRRKKTSGIVSLIGAVLLIAGVALPPSESSALVTDLKDSVESLENENKKLTLLVDEHESAEEKLSKEFEDKLEEINTDFEKIEMENSKLLKNEKSLKKEIKKIEKDNNELIESENNLKDKVADLESSNKKLNNKVEPSKQASEKQQAQSQSKTSSSTSQQNSTNNAKTTKNVTQKTETKQECNIKGSSGGIYHTPSSSYYSQTTNPVAMFCSVEEAEAAGYRAPKR